MSTRDEFKHRLVGSADMQVWLTRHVFEQMCDRIDTLTAENARLAAELRSLRAAVATLRDGVVKFGVHDCAIVDQLCALVPSDGSWGTP